MFLIWVALICLMVFLYKKIKIALPRSISAWIYYPVHTIVMAFSIGLCIAGMRGGFLHSTRPITLRNAGEYVKRSKEMYLILNTPFSMLRTIGKANFKHVHYFESEEELETIYSPLHYPKDTLPFHQKNVIIIVLENFSKKAINDYNKHLI